MYGFWTILHKCASASVHFSTDGRKSLVLKLSKHVDYTLIE